MATQRKRPGASTARRSTSPTATSISPTAEQVRETAAKHFAGQTDLLLVAVDAGSLGEALKWEVSRGGALFPHLYAPLDPSAVLWVKPLPLGADGVHVFPADLA